MFYNLNFLNQIKGTYKLNYNLAKLTWFKVGGNADIFFKPLDLEDLQNFLILNNKKLPISVIGAGSNILISDLGVRGIVIRLVNEFTKIHFLDDKRLSVGAGCLNFNLVKFAQMHSLSGMEFLSGIPGNIGGAIKMNAGAYDTELKDILVSIEAIDHEGNILEFSKDECNFAYRKNNLRDDLIYTRAILKYEKGDIFDINKKIKDFNYIRSQNQPSKRTCGSVFLNPPKRKTWEIIDSLGLRGAEIGGASISSKHANFIVNNGNAKSKDILSLIQKVKILTKKQLGIELIVEIKHLGITEYLST